MRHHKQHFPRSNRPVRKKGRHTPLKPGADARLKKIFAGIGIPPSREFCPDPFQVDALAAIQGADCLVTAPTGSGKTWIAERAIARIHEAGGNCWYACPLKALIHRIRDCRPQRQTGTCWHQACGNKSKAGDRRPVRLLRRERIIRSNPLDLARFENPTHPACDSAICRCR